MGIVKSPMRSYKLGTIVKIGIAGDVPNPPGTGRKDLRTGLRVLKGGHALDKDHSTICPHQGGDLTEIFPKPRSCAMALDNRGLVEEI